VEVKGQKWKFCFQVYRSVTTFEMNYDDNNKKSGGSILEDEENNHNLFFNVIPAVLSDLQEEKRPVHTSSLPGAVKVREILEGHAKNINLGYVCMQW
jgi:hypothetical protein